MPIPADRTNVVAISAGSEHDLLLKSDGTVSAWGLNQDLQTDVPDSLSNVVKIAAGGYHSIVLTSNGTVFAWGRDNSGQSEVPPGVSNLLAIAAGCQHNVGLMSNGTLVAWGDNGHGQTLFPAGTSNVLAVAAGQFDSLALIGDAPAIPALRAEDAAYVQGVFSVSVQTRSGKDYRLEYKDNLDDPIWNELPAQPGDGTVMRLSGPADVPQRYFRVREL